LKPCIHDCVEAEILLCVCSAPFTIQRLCELLIDPMKHYKTMEKFMRAIEKVTEIILHYIILVVLVSYDS